MRAAVPSAAAPCAQCGRRRCLLQACHVAAQHRGQVKHQVSLSESLEHLLEKSHERG
jgi:hypothetical protein